MAKRKKKTLTDETIFKIIFTHFSILFFILYTLILTTTGQFTIKWFVIGIILFEVSFGTSLYITYKFLK